MPSSVYVQRAITTWNWRKTRAFEEKFWNTNHEWRQSRESRFNIAEISSLCPSLIPSLSLPTLLYPFPSNKSTQGEKNKMAMQDLVAPQIFLCVGQENWTRAFLLQCGRKCTCTNISTHISKGKIDQDSTDIKANCTINRGLIVMRT